MKKQLALAAAILATAVSASAQTQVLKDAERAMKDGKPAAEVANIITPAFTDPETKDLAQTYFIPGKASFTEYDHLLGLQALNKLPEGGNATMANDLLNGYDFFMKALPLDSVADAKGKIKTKYSKEIVNTLAGHHNDFNSCAITFWELRDFKGAYRSWDIYLGMIKNPVFAKSIASNVPADTIIGEIYYNQALAAWQADELQSALTSFKNAHSYGYAKKQLFDYALAVAANLNDNEETYKIASQAQEIFGAEDATYIGYIINYYLQNKDFDKAFQRIDEAIANNPNNSQYYFVKGILFDNQDKKADAKGMFAKAIELDPNNWQALLQYGRSLCEEAYALSDAAPANPAEFEKMYNEQIVPLFKEAAEYLERSYDANQENPDALRYLENVYYNLKDEAKLQDVKNRQAAL